MRIQRLDRTFKDGTVNASPAKTATNSETQVADFVAADDFDLWLHAAQPPHAYEYFAKIWRSEPDRYIVDQIHQMPGLKT